MFRFSLVLTVGFFATAASAQNFDEGSASAQLFSTKGYGLRVSGSLSEKDRATIKALIPLMARKMGQGVRYYTSIAYAPDEGLVSETLQGAVNFHSPAAADAAAIAACNAVRRGGKRCVLAARVVPENYERRTLTLSVEATSAFETQYRRAQAPKAFAISPTSGAWGIGKSDAAAVANCAEKRKNTRDCKVVIRD